MKYKYFSYLIFSGLIFYSCANQLPPTGGDDDKTPPKIISVYPKPDTKNFRDNKLTFRFDEYVERRSFEEAFSISPKPKGGIEFDWSGTEVEVDFSKPFELNKTYVVIIGKDLKDIRGGNSLTKPVSFAFSTGNKIDKGIISGTIFADNYDRVKAMLYLKDNKQADKLDPGKNPPDYTMQVSADGSYEFTNLPNGDYRLFAVSDEDRNNLFDKDLDKIAVLSDDIKLSPDSNKISGINFLLKDFELNKYNIKFADQLKADSINFIYSNIGKSEKNIPPDYRFYFYFKNNSLSKTDIVNNFSLNDSATGKSYRLVFNWINDSLAEIFSAENFKPGSDLNITIDLKNTVKKYFYTTKFSVAGKNNFGIVSGKIISAEKISSPVYIKLYNKDNIFISYSIRLVDSSEFKFDEVLEGSYTILSFIDVNGDGRPDKGNYYPFSPSERFMVYEKEIKVKGGWNVDNVFLKY